MTNDRSKFALILAGLAVLGLIVYSATRDGDELAVEGGNPVTGAPTTTTTVAGRVDEPIWRINVTRVTDGLNRLFMAPDPARTADYVDPACPCFKDIEDRLKDMQSQGRRFDRNVLEVTDSFFVSEARTGEVKVALTLRLPPARLVDRRGTVVQTQTELDSGRTDYTIKADEQGIWRLIDRVTPSGER